MAGAILFAVLPAMIPVAQMHYWAHAMPLAAVLIVEHWRQTGKANHSLRLACWSAVAFAAYIATDTHLWSPLRHHGPSTIVMLALVAAGFFSLRACRAQVRGRSEISDRQELPAN